MPEHVRVAVALVHRNGRWLVARRPDGVHLGGLWEFPGGKCEPGETIEQTALRELAEECAIEAEIEQELPDVIHEYPERTVHLTPLVCRWSSGEAQPLASDACQWVTLSELRKLDMPEGNVAILDELQVYA